ncbi:sigma-54-dependent transcriptional regulator [Methylophilus medardicus]|uniref:Sigma-54-dependent Fis family transcriptional regulator n=1 Tax=Methylophilus medardicus TaxID=2588534 RepID=A0A5B8CVL2_9PROT|nr:sigma-54 dependent transcriptional regulator [Methylophilus medardicus]QDC45110.1 sigma-54-dependent Fis family transcriptional regulator [Methylophilus medardicus]QDC50117.1 sigma-54-dependent Fis family transcriptional regulator [Methylophilus medardicus]QDC53822.1 sigma-54-dependent Fis family transcriptional regulator [Methylophilus medardicus]
MSSPQYTILAVDDEPHMRRLLEISLRQAGYRALSASHGQEALALIQQQQIDLVVSDLHMPGMNGLQLLAALRKQYERLPFIMVTAQGEINTAVEAMKLGANDYILRPFELEALEIAITKALAVNRIQLENTFLKESSQPSGNGLIGNSAPMQSLKQMIQQVAPERATVFIVGETGTGKELVAKALHDASPRKSALFVAVNCAAIPVDILESELFGHEKGAFTGAVKERVGKFELANGGTLFLDEITEMPIQLQAKLLRVLQENVVEKLGGNRQIALDVRVVAATNRDPLQAVKEGKLREDVYYRLNVIQLQIPPLRERGDDVSLLADYFLSKRQTQLSAPARECLLAYRWPGNVRELENILERAAILAGNQTIQCQHLPADISQTPVTTSQTLSPDASAANDLSIPRATESIERRLILQALDACQGNKTKAAKLLEISERSLWNKLNQYGLR